MPRNTPPCLTSEEQAFFGLVYEAVKANPFGEKRIELDLKITGLAYGASTQDRIPEMVNEIENRFRKFQDQKIDIQQYRDQDKTFIRTAVLFVLFHNFIEEFDQHIEKQIEAGEKPQPVKFAQKAFDYMKKRGFTKQEALHYFALCFQLRRTFYFIDRSIKGQSRSMIQLKESLWNNVFTNSLDIYESLMWNRMEDFSTMILGETGTGKGAVAKAIGRSGYIPFDESKNAFTESFNRSFVSLNLSQYSESLIESELFGHKKGAFTGAINDRPGIFDQASPHGAIFLDEIGEVSIPVQIKLLKVLEERVFLPVGGYEPRRFKGRIIAATNRSVEEIMGKNTLRRDFFYRLCSDMIIMPPLRQRFAENPEELDELLAFTIEKILGVSSPRLEKLVKSTIEKYPGRTYSWPGNVREFAQCVRSILLNHKYMDMHTLQTSGPEKGFLGKVQKGELDSTSLLQGYCHALYQKSGTYGEVARQTRMDWRTVKKYVLEWDKKQP